MLTLGTILNLACFLFSGSTIKGVVAILNCILARQLCFEDPSCSAILEIIPRVCGPIPAAMPVESMACFCNTLFEKEG
ncbi:hypothetical protein M5D96_002774 [Drosophila gunungcola]|uniref:Uncharacterized protein n=1 Tax=Drosophila gunungcola TaxID=103775 RepID=A0A9P9Z0J6_9MUSC|nr:hypothetical protein M5D96_002774 [Drosophila gunungcola]